MTLDQQNLRNFFTHHNLSTTKNHRFFLTYCKLYGDDEDDDDDDDGGTCLRLIPIHCVRTWLYARVQKFEKSGEISHILLHFYTHMAFFLLLAPIYLNTRYYRQSAYVAVLYTFYRKCTYHCTSYKSSDNQSKGKYVYIHIVSLLFSFFKAHAMNTESSANNRGIYIFSTRFYFWY